MAGAEFIVGESYGTTRAAGLARRLQDRYGLYVRGLVLLSSALNLQVVSFDPGNDLPYVLSLPSYTAVAFYHGKLWDRPSFGLERSLRTVQAWALSDYLPALTKGTSLSPGESRQTAEKLAAYTGLRQDVIAGNHLRISAFGFTQDLLSGESRMLGLLDGRVTSPSVSSRAGRGPIHRSFSSPVRSSPPSTATFGRTSA